MTDTTNECPRCQQACIVTVYVRVVGTTTSRMDLPSRMSREEADAYAKKRGFSYVAYYVDMHGNRILPKEKP